MLSPVWAHARPLRIVFAVMADIRAGVEAKTAVEDLSAVISPLLLGRVRVRVMGGVRVKIGLGVGFGLGL